MQKNNSKHFCEAMLVQMPGFHAWKDLSSKFIAGNLNIAKLLGYVKIEHIVGIFDNDAKCEAALCAAEFQRQDQKVIAQQYEMTIIDIHPYAGGTKSMLSKKKPFYNEFGEVIGIMGSMVEIGDQWDGLCKTLLQLEKPFRSKKEQNGGVTKELVASADFANLTERESEILFYFVYGYTARDIGLILGRTTRTIESHLNNIKNKIGITKKSDLILFCIENGFLSLLPKSILNKALNISIEI